MPLVPPGSYTYVMPNVYTVLCNFDCIQEIQNASKRPYKAGVRDLEPTVRKCTSVPSNTIPQSSLSRSKKLKKVPCSKLTPCSKQPRLTLLKLLYMWALLGNIPILGSKDK